MVRRWHFEYLKRSVITRSERETESERERKREKQKREEKRERRGETGETRVENSETRREGTQNEANGVNLPGCRGSSLLSPPSHSHSLSLSLSLFTGASPSPNTLYPFLFIFLLRRTGRVSRDKISPGLFLLSEDRVAGGREATDAPGLQRDRMQVTLSRAQQRWQTITPVAESIRVSFRGCFRVSEYSNTERVESISS